MKKILSLILSVALLCTSELPCRAKRNEGIAVEDYAQRYIIKYSKQSKNTLKKDVIENIYNDCKKNNSKKNKKKQKAHIKNKHISYRENHYEVIIFDDDIDSASFISAMNETYDSEIEYIQPDYVIKLSGEETPEVFDFDIQKNENEDNSELKKAVIAVLDSGMDIYMDIFEGRIVPGYDFCNNTELIEVNYNSTEDIHATHIAGTIISEAENSQIMPLKVFDGGKAYTSDVIKAIEFAENNGAQIVNCSWGGNEYNEALKEAIDSSNLLFVCAAGNGGKNIDETPVYPACFDSDNIITVASVNDDFGLSGFSNYGEKSVDISAKGRDVYGAYLADEYGTMSGTSVSAGFISAAAAICVGKEKKDIKSAILNSSDTVSCLEGKISGAKYVNIENIRQDLPGENKELSPISDIDTEILNRSEKESWELFCLEDNIKVATSDVGMYVLKSDGTVWMTPSGYSYIAQIPTIKNIVYMTDDAKLLIDNNGKVYYWEGIYWTDDDNISSPEELTGITNAQKAYSNEGTFFVVCEDGTTWGWGANLDGQAGGTEVNGYINEDGLWIEEGYFDVEYPQIIECGSKKDMLTVGVTYVLSEDGKLSRIGDYNYNPYIDFSADGYGGYENVSHLAYTLEHEPIIIYDNGDVLYYNSETNKVKCADFKLTGIKETTRNIVVFNNGKAGILHYRWEYGEMGGSTKTNELELSYCPVNNIKSVSGTYDSRCYAIKNDDTVWSWFIGEDGSQYEPEQESLEIGIGHGTVLITEDYSKPGSGFYNMNSSGLQSIGWSEQENEFKSGNNYQSANNGEVVAENGRLVIRKTSSLEEPEEAGAQALVYSAQKQFTYSVKNWQGDPHVTMRMNNFKGKYAVEYTGSFQNNDSQVYYDMLGKTSTGQEAVIGRYRIDSGFNGYFSVYNNKLNGADTNRYHLWRDGRIKREFSTYMNTTAGNFRTFLDNSGIAVETIVDDASPKDIFLMTDWNPKGEDLYFTGIRISGQKQEYQNADLAQIDKLRLIEYVDEDEKVKAAAVKLNMSYLTDTPDQVRENLKSLPSEMDGMNITWSSSSPEIMTDEGEIVGDIIFDTDLSMTAKITDPVDGFTRYLDFKLRLVKKEGIAERYLENEKGTPADQTHSGSKTLYRYPAWHFEYPGMDFGENRQMHSSQIMTENGYMVFKKIADRQTADYSDCLVGRRYLCYSGDVYSFRGRSELKITAKAAGTGTFRFGPEALDGTVPFSIALDASNKKVFVVYSENNEQVIQNLDINPLIEHEYKMVIDTNGTFELYIDGNIIEVTENITERDFLNNTQNPYNISKIKVWITNVTKADTKAGYLKSVIFNPLENYDTENQSILWKDVETLYRENIIQKEVTKQPEIAEGLLVSDVNLSSGNYDFINRDLTVNQPVGIERGGYTTIWAELKNNNESLTYVFGVHVPHFRRILFEGISNGTKRDDTVGININVRNAKLLKNKKFTVMYDSEQFRTEDLSMLTYNHETATGHIDGTDVVIMKNYNGLLEFVVNTEVPEEWLLTTVINSVKFKSIADGEKEILFTVTELK